MESIEQKRAERAIWLFKMAAYDFEIGSKFSMTATIKQAIGVLRGCEDDDLSKYTVAEIGYKK